MGQDSEMAKRLGKAGHKSYFVADAIVRHTIKKETATEDWIVRRAERLGYGIFAVKDGDVGYKRQLPAFIPLLAELIFNRVKWTLICGLGFFMGRRRKFWGRWGFYFYRGLLKGYREFL
jgi:GT2 family glycosyltransferase